MRGYERLGFALRSLLGMGYELSIDVNVPVNVPTMSTHWAYGTSVLVGKIKMKNEGDETSFEFHADDSHKNFHIIVEILKRIKEE